VIYHPFFISKPSFAIVGLDGLTKSVLMLDFVTTEWYYGNMTKHELVKTLAKQLNLTSSQVSYRISPTKEVRTLVKEICQGRCVRCGGTSPGISIHHINA
jgi:hypothetical protein